MYKGRSSHYELSQRLAHQSPGEIKRILDEEIDGLFLDIWSYKDVVLDACEIGVELTDDEAKEIIAIVENKIVHEIGVRPQIHDAIRDYVAGE